MPADVLTENHGSVALLTPMTPDPRQSVEEHVEVEPWQWGLLHRLRTPLFGPNCRWNAEERARRPYRRVNSQGSFPSCAFDFPQGRDTIAFVPFDFVPQRASGIERLRRRMWMQNVMGMFEGRFAASVARHDVSMIRLWPKGQCHGAD